MAGRRLRIAAAFALLALHFAILAPPAAAATGDTLVVGGDAGYPPFQFLDGRGRPTGFDVELLRLVGRELDRDVQFELGAWGHALQRLDRREVDVVPMFVSSPRSERFLFTRPYLMRYHGVFGRHGQPEVTRLEELQGSTVAVQEQGLGWEALQALGTGAPAILSVGTEPEALRLVAEGRAEYALVPTGIGFHAIDQGGLEQVVPLSPSLLEHGYALAVRRDRPQLAAALDDALARVRHDGRQDQLYRRWLGQPGSMRSAGAGAAWAWWLLPLALLGAILAWRRHRLQPAARAGAGMGAAAPSSVQLLKDLRQSIADGSLGFALQPKQYLDTGRWSGAELLVRWNHPRHGELAPGDFVPLAEKAGEIAPMTLYLIRRGVEELAQWPSGPRQPTLSVNVAANDLANPALVDAIVAAAAGHGHSLILELTESDIMLEPGRVADALPRLREHGIRISLDDFGTGHSSLTYLRRLAPEEIKIDRSFVGSLLDSGSDRAIVRATIQLAHELGAQVTAEGIEDEETRRWLAAAGCDIAQGFGIARPMPPGDFAELLRAQHN